MQKLLSCVLMAVACLSVQLAYGRSVGFGSGDGGGLHGWKQDTSQPFQPAGRVTLPQGFGGRAVDLSSTRAPVVIVWNEPVVWKVGRTVRLSATVSGGGLLKLSVYFYDRHYRWLGSSSASIRPEKEARRHTVLLTDDAMVSDPVYAHVALSQAHWNSTCRIENLEVDAPLVKDVELPFSADEVKGIQLSALSAEKLSQATFGGFGGVIPEAAGVKPVLDGMIGAEEWRHAVKITGFTRVSKGLIPNESGTVWLMRDGTHLYVAVRTTAPNNDPGAGLISKATQRDGAVYDDDSVELMLRPDTDPDTCYHILINPHGVIFDRKVGYARDTADIDWNIQGMETKSMAQSALWDLEVKIPLSEIGSPRRHVDVNVARNWYSFGATALNPTALHINPKRLGRFLLTSDLPYMRMHSLGTPTKGIWDVQLEAVNPSSRPCYLAGMIRSYSWHRKGAKTRRRLDVQAAQEVLVKAGERRLIRLEAQATSADPRTLSAVLYDADGGQVLGTRVLSAEKEQFGLDMPGMGLTEVPGIGTVNCWHYPSYNKARLQFQLEESALRSELWADFGAEKVQVKRSLDGIQAVVPLPPTAGEHTLHLTVDDGKGGSRRISTPLTLTRKVFPWENNQLGTEKVILPPFTPIAVKGSCVETILRKHIFGADGLWRQLEAKGRDLFTLPMAWSLTVNGKRQELTPVEPLRLQVDAIGYAMKAEVTLGAGKGLRLHAMITFDYDGFCWYEYDLRNELAESIDRLTLGVTMKASETPFFHVISNTIRSNPGGTLPAGEGEIWTGAQLKRKGGMHPQLVPHLWLGGIERGFTWFTDSSYGFKLRKDVPSVRISRKGPAIRLEIDIINRSVIPKDGHRFAFGIQATPVKPVDPALREYTYDSHGRGVPGMKNLQALTNGSMMGFPSQWAKVPAGKDYSLFQHFTAASRRSGAFDYKPLQEAYFARHDGEIVSKVEACPKLESYEGMPHERSVRSYAAYLAFQSDHRSSLPYKYSDPRLAFFPNEIPQAFRSEWWIGMPGYFGAWRTFPVQSMIDYMLYGYHEELKHGMHGTYLDDVFIIPGNNPDTVARYDDEGELHPCLGILALRQLVRRLAVIQHSFNRYPRVLIVHMTNAQLIPCFSFATSQLAWEAQFGETPLPTRYTLDQVCAEGLGLRLGVDSTALGGVMRRETPKEQWPARKAQLSRTFLTLAMPHEVKIWNRLSPSDIDWNAVKNAYRILNEFGHWKTDCRFIPYWEPETGIRADAGQVIVSAYQRRGGLLLIVANLKGKVTTAIQLDRKKLGISEAAVFINCETGKQETLNSVTIPDYDFKLLKLKQQ